MSTGRVVFGCSLAVLLTFAALVGVFLLASGEDKQRLIIAAIGDTEYAPNYSERAFEQLPLGATHAEVIAALGPPFGEHDGQPVHYVLYAVETAGDFAETGSLRGIHNYTCFDFGSEGRFRYMSSMNSHRTGTRSWHVEYDMDGTGNNHLRVDARQLEAWKLAGAAPAEIEARFGPPTAIHRNPTVRWMRYSRSPSDGHYQRRWIGLDQDGRVCFKRAEAYWD